MANKVQVTQFGIIHYHAICSQCDFNPAFAEFTPEQVRSKSRRHVKDTGHTVNIESGTSTEYKAISYE